MAALTPPVCDFGLPALDFSLSDADGRIHTLASARGPRGLLVMFICNHCPFVKAVIHRIVRDCSDLAEQGIGSIAIMPNDLDSHPEDGPEHMARWVREFEFPFPYVIDASQDVARNYGAVCTPDFFGYNVDLQLQYRGRLDASRREAVADAPRELFLAMQTVARTGKGPLEQQASIGCSIKWRES